MVDMSREIRAGTLETNNLRIPCEVEEAPGFFLGLIGRMICTAIHKDEKTFTVLDGFDYFKIKVETEADIERIERIACRDRGSLYVKIRPNKLGYVLDEPIIEYT